jgi:hypothetical protein
LNALTARDAGSGDQHGDEVFMSVVFPVADLRPVLWPESQTISAPFRKRTSGSYARRFGAGKYRNLQRTHSVESLVDDQHSSFKWRIPPALIADENWFISAKRFIHVPNGPVQPRLFADGFISARLEVPLVFPMSKIKDTGVDCVRHLLETPVELRSSRPKKRSPERRNVPLSSVGPYFRDALLSATTPEPLRREIRDNPDSDAARKARSALFALEPVILVIMPASAFSAPNVQLRFNVVGTETASFRLLSVYPNSAANLNVVRMARRSFTRLHAEGSAILKLFENPPSATAMTFTVVNKLESLADRLCDAHAALATTEGAAVPLLGEIGPTVAAAATELGNWLDGAFPGSGRSQRRLAKELLRAAPIGQTVEVRMGDIFSGIQNSTIINKSIVKDAFNKVSVKD